MVFFSNIFHNSNYDKGTECTYIDSEEFLHITDDTESENYTFVAVKFKD